MDVTKLNKLLFLKPAPKTAVPVLSGSVKLKSALKKDVFEKTGAISKEALDKIKIGNDFPLTPRAVSKISSGLNEEGQKYFETYKKLFEEAFSGIGTEFKGRVKDINSIYKKICTKGVMFKDGQVYLPDTIGYKLISNGSEKEADSIVKQIEKLIDDGALVPERIINHGNTPYLNEAQTQRLSRKGFNIVQNPRKTNFNNVNVLFKNKNGMPVELQITGAKSEKINAKEHFSYKFGKEAFGTEGFEEYQKYADKCYAYARNLELGIVTEKPILPEAFSGAKELLNLVE